MSINNTIQWYLFVQVQVPVPACSNECETVVHCQQEETQDIGKISPAIQAAVKENLFCVL